jgi:murein DD-endopeptidase MepM/ murein hydrolase activator NlpD
MQRGKFYSWWFQRGASKPVVPLARLVIAALGLVIYAPLLGGRLGMALLPPVKQAAPTVREPSRIDVKLRRGDTLLSVLNRLGLEATSAHAFVEQLRPFLNPRRIRAGHDLNVLLGPEGKTVQSVEIVIDDSLVRVKATADGWQAERREIPFVRETSVVRGTIDSSLYQSGIEAGLTPQQILDLAKIFEYDIDFFSDFQPQDDFVVAVEEIHYEDGRTVQGRIIAAELEANDETYKAFYFAGKDGEGSYYDAEGRAVRRAFLRAPLSFARISSPYSLNRRHPIFRTVRPHRAIDYAAPAGTPVVAIGRGRVEFVGWRNGYGNVVDIRHSSGYMSRYAHFSRFAAGIRKGKTVNAGDVVGYVGQTGHATGPHLHFEFLRNGRKLNFLAMKLPKVERLTGDDLRRFHHQLETQQALLENRDIRIVEKRTPSEP